MPGALFAMIFGVMSMPEWFVPNLATCEKVRENGRACAGSVCV